MLLRRFLYRHFRGVSSLKFWLQRRVTQGGWLALVGLGASALLGLDTQQTVAYQLFTFLAALLALALGCSLWFRGRFAVSRTLPRFGSVGEPLAYRIIVRNETTAPQRGLVLFENVLDPLPSFEEFIQTPEPGEEGRNWFDRHVGYYRWAWLISRHQGATLREQLLPALPPRDQLEVRLEILPSRRGYLRLSGVTLARPDPFGLFRSCLSVPAPGSLLVLPKRYPLPHLRLPGTRKYQRGGVALTTSVGESEEFVSLRDYRPGDPLRRIHWRSWPKVGKLAVKEYQDEFFVRHALVLDTFAGPAQQEMFEEAVSVAASFACAIQTQESLLDLMFMGPEAYCVTAGRGLGHTDRMLEILACVRVCQDRPFHALHRLVLERHQALSGCICVLLGWDAARQQFIHQLRGVGIRTLVLVIVEALPGDVVTPGPGQEPAEGVHRLEMGKIAEGLARL